MKTIKHDILCVPKYVTWYQKYAHITACLVTGYIPRVWKQDHILFKLPPGKINSGDHEYQGRNTEACPYTYNNLPSNHGSPQKPQCTT